MSSLIPLWVAYSAALFVAVIIGIRLSDRVTITHTRMQIVMSFVSGLMLGVAVFHLLPHAVYLLGDQGGIDRVATWLMLGLLSMFLLLRLFHFHHHDLAEDGHDSHCAEAHLVTGDSHAHVAHTKKEASAEKPAVHQFEWVGIVFGLAVHTLIDGIALGASMRASLEHEPQAMMLAGFGVFLAIMLHKPLDALTINSMMSMADWSKRSRYLVVTGFALLCPLSAAIFLFVIDSLQHNSEVFIALALAFSAGVFLCISLSDLLPEVHFHSHDRFIMTLALLLGIGIALMVKYIEPDGVHEHRHLPLQQDHGPEHTHEGHAH